MWLNQGNTSGEWWGQEDNPHFDFRPHALTTKLDTLGLPVCFLQYWENPKDCNTTFPHPWNQARLGVPPTRQHLPGIALRGSSEGLGKGRTETFLRFQQDSLRVIHASHAHTSFFSKGSDLIFTLKGTIVLWKSEYLVLGWQQEKQSSPSYKDPPMCQGLWNPLH